MHQHDSARDSAQRQRPVKRGVAAAGDYHGLIGEIGEIAYAVMNVAIFKRSCFGKREALRYERAIPGGQPRVFLGCNAAGIARRRHNSLSILGNHDLLLLCVLEEVRLGRTPEAVLRSGDRRSLAPFSGNGE